jgi:DNA polymerase-3 subunit alpha
LLDGAIRLDELFPKALSLGMKQVAMTDHGNLFGALDFYLKTKAHGVKPILGCETYVAQDRFDRSERKSHHLVLVAKDLTGWKNLSYLNSMAFLEGFYYNPRIDRKLLRERSQGLVALSACLGGAVSRAILYSGMETATEVAREYADIMGARFGAGRDGEPDGLGNDCACDARGDGRAPGLPVGVCLLRRQKAPPI